MLKRPPQRVPAGAQPPPTSQEPVKIILRVRPLLPQECSAAAATEDSSSCVRVVDSNQVEILNARNSHESFLYHFDRCHPESSRQEDIFSSVLPVIDSCLVGGRNATVFAYGITGAGKTFTMDGSAGQPGLIPRAVRHLFRTIHQWKTTTRKTLIVQVLFSHLEVYNEKVFDLQSVDRLDLPLRQDADGNIVVANLTETPIDSFDAFERLYSRTRDNRSTAATKLNALSSRSHSVLRISLVTEEHGKRRTSKLQLIDLAGSEDNRKTGNDKDRMIESGNINKSLFMLNQVVESLNSGATNIPYRNSKLTRLLQDSLGGKSVAMMITNVAPSARFYLDTLNTLNMARRTRQIVNRTEMNQELVVGNKPAPSASLSRSTSVSSMGADKQLLSRKMSSENMNVEKKIAVSAGVKKEPVKSLGAPLREPVSKPTFVKPRLPSENPAKPLSKINEGAVKKAEVQTRIHELEKRVEKAEQSSSVWGDILNIATPGTKRGLARACLVAAKEHRSKGDLIGALHQYEKASEVQPSQKLTAIINELRAELNGDEIQSPVVRPPNAKKGRALADSSEPVTDFGFEQQQPQPAAKKPKLCHAAGRPLVVSSPEATPAKPIPPVIPDPATAENIENKENESGTASLKELEDMAEKRLLAMMNSGDGKVIRAIRGLGQKRAQHIIEYQQIYGDYKVLEDLKAAGLGDKLIKNIRNDFLVNSLATTRISL